MESDFFKLEGYHIDIEDPTRLLFWGYLLKKISPANVTFHAEVNKNTALIKLIPNGDNLFKRIFRGKGNDNKVVGFVYFPDVKEDETKLNIKLFVTCEDNSELLIERNFYFKKKILGLCYSIDQLFVQPDRSTVITGWALDRCQVDIQLSTKSGQKVNIERKRREDVLLEFPERVSDDPNVGFYIKVPNLLLKDMPWKITFQGADGSLNYEITRRTVAAIRWKNAGGVRKAIVRTQESLKDNGKRATLRKAAGKIKNIVKKKPEDDYQSWIKKTEPDQKELNDQHEWYLHALKKEDKASNEIPLFSIVVAVYRTPKKYLKALIDSITSQTYSKWELILADAGKGSDEKSPNTDYLQALSKKDSRIKYFLLAENRSISENTNAAIKKASGDWIVFIDHDDTISPEAFYLAAKAIFDNPGIQYIYSDEDKIDATGKRRSEPNFKPDYNPDLLNSMNYVSHLSLVKKSLIDKVGLLDPAFNGAQDYDLTLRCVEKLNANQILHISQILYHWRSYELSTAGNQESKLYAFEAGKRAVQAHLDRMGIPGTVVETEYYGRYRIRYHWNIKPLVSIIIPNKDHVDDLDRCIKSILRKTSYPNYEIIIVENNSTEKQTEEYYEKINKDERIKVVYYKGSFNYSKINNYGISFAKGQFYLLLNNDTEVITPDWLSEMTNICMRRDVGIVGAKLYYPDDTIQHAGVIIGIGGVAGHAFKYYPRKDQGYFSRAVVVQDYSAVTAACLLVKKQAYEQVHGLTEELAVAFNDVDFCLKVGEAGYRIVFTPYAELYHYESKSRGAEDTEEKQARFRQEILTFRKRWGSLVEKGDPCYNRHLSLEREDFSFNKDL
ncbi:glycosyltransferase family 2 protein [Lachnospiraceae bacterium YH-ros2228]